MFRSLVVVLVMVIGQAMPAMAQQLTDQEARRIAEQLVAAWDKAAIAKDAAGTAALFAKDGIQVTPQGLFVGPAEVEKWRAQGVKSFTDDPSVIGRVSVINNDTIVIAGSWSGHWLSPNGPIPMSGFWSQTEVRDGGTWRIRLSGFNVTPPPAQ